ncbi:hypothetical protein J3F83DRAFT_697728 [Trichoderma novae-zelandiae]
MVVPRRRQRRCVTAAIRRVLRGVVGSEPLRTSALCWDSRRREGMGSRESCRLDSRARTPVPVLGKVAWVGLSRKQSGRRPLYQLVPWAAVFRDTASLVVVTSSSQTKLHASPRRRYRDGGLLQLLISNASQAKGLRQASPSGTRWLKSRAPEKNCELSTHWAAFPCQPSGWLVTDAERPRNHGLALDRRPGHWAVVWANGDAAGAKSSVRWFFVRSSLQVQIRHRRLHAFRGNL